MKQEKLLTWYQTMLKIRQFELLVEAYNEDRKIYGTSHLYIGQEAVATGIISLLDSQDLVLSTHRNHGHAIAKGVATEAMFAEIFGKENGTNGGRAGSMLISDLSLGFIGGNGIVGGNFPLALGLAQAIRMDKRDQRVVCFSGDGAVNQGTFYESLNLARVWNLPIVFVIENNRYAMSTPSSEVTSGTLQSRAESMDIPYFQVDGQNIFAVTDTFKLAIRTLKSGPAILEAHTYRFKGHSRSDKNENYRHLTEREGVADPLDILKTNLIKKGVALDEIEQSEAGIQQELKEQAERVYASLDTGGRGCQVEN
ncbi:Pyruvate dehydrogenase E1 component alpha subunit [Streptococcus sp. DD10]|uniref:thiamine pyrophosphate-dependent dehydrogenase E1 component subunit alpha n=1 Tax=Streptococcus sp. DD10 TaxID=1777878 RepID=UPI00079C7821|nr:thiamine pyrophosphate-dependent dehydrogenase E1 component subunit alpha [Streptococcus sp. DD10]KXT72404.1 Pyruvate dehydrogenase E1 component alpha subunit [Streptococcus sp. DD10]